MLLNEYYDQYWMVKRLNLFYNSSFVTWTPVKAESPKEDFAATSWALFFGFSVFIVVVVSVAEAASSSEACPEGTSDLEADETQLKHCHLQEVVKLSC
jgi:hypothetical protein